MGIFTSWPAWPAGPWIGNWIGRQGVWDIQGLGGDGFLSHVRFSLSGLLVHVMLVTVLLSRLLPSVCLRQRKEMAITPSWYHLIGQKGRGRWETVVRR